MLHFLSTALLFVGVLLESALLALLWTRRKAVRLPMFFGLIAFYIVRSLVVFATGRWLPPLQRAELSAGMAALDVLLQIALGCSLFLRAGNGEAVQGNGLRASPFRTLLLPLDLVLACAFTLLLVRNLPAWSPVPFDRGSAVCAFFFLELFAQAAFRKAGRRLERTVLGGFAALGLADLISQCGRVIAAGHREPRLFLGFAYLEAVTWLVILLAWMVRLREGREDRPLNVTESGESFGAVAKMGLPRRG